MGRGSNGSPHWTGKGIVNYILVPRREKRGLASIMLLSPKIEKGSRAEKKTDSDGMCRRGFFPYRGKGRIRSGRGSEGEEEE